MSWQILDVGIYDLTYRLSIYQAIRKAPFGWRRESICAAAGLGGTFKQFSVEARYYTPRATDGRADISTLYETIIIPLRNDYQKMSIIFVYRLL